MSVFRIGFRVRVSSGFYEPGLVLVVVRFVFPCFLV